MKAYAPVSVAATPQVRQRHSAGSNAVAILDDRMDPLYTEALEEALRLHFGPGRVRLWFKPHGNRPSPPDLVAEVAEAAEYAVVGVGL